MSKKKSEVVFTHVMSLMKGLWPRCIAFKNPEFYEALEFPGKPVPCPMHYEDGVRITFAENGNDTGGFFCPECGHFPNGIVFLMWAKNLTLNEALTAIQDWHARYEHSIRTGKPDKTTQPQYMRLPLPRRHSPKINRFTEARRRMEAEKPATEPTPKAPLPKVAPIEAKQPEPKRPTLAERLGKKRPLPWSDHR